MNSVLAFLRQLEKNNNREWFQNHKVDYDSVKTELLNFTESLIRNSLNFAPELQELQAKDCIFRIFRDTRFSKNKLPYKNNLGAYLSKGGKKSTYAGYYLHLQPGASFVAGGLWMPEARELQLVRQEIYFQPESFQKLIGSKAFKSNFGQIEGEKLKNPPKGFEKDHPAIEWLKMKSFIASASLSDKEVGQPDFQKVVLRYFKAMAPLVDYLNQALDMQE